VLTRDGAELRVRRIRPSDREGVQRLVAGLSEQSRYQRFLRPVKALGAAELTHLTDLDHRDAEALVAVDDDGRIAGVARYFRLEDRPEAAEVAVTIADEWQHRGVGTGLLHELTTIAEDNGIETFVALCLATNADMLLLLRELGEGGVRRIGGDHGAIEVEVSLPTDARHRVAPALGALSRAPGLRPHPRS
jgi:GNAT superfamily N-acetyltransferase